jgi:hypothetical protein
MRENLERIKEIRMKIVPHGGCRNNGVGDYWFEGDVLQIRASKLPDNRHSLLILVHELIEVLQAESNCIPEEEITDFDRRFETDRAEGNTEEPGDDDAAPYREEHCIATAVERLMCALLGCSWKQYDRSCSSL